MIVVTEVTNEGGACPYQVEGLTDKGESVYARYRWGYLRVEVNGEVVFGKQIGEDQNDDEVLAEYKAHGMNDETLEKMATSFKNMRAVYDGSPICFDGYMDMEQLREITAGEIQWPEI